MFRPRANLLATFCVGESPQDARRSQYFLPPCVFHFFSRRRNALFGVGTREGGETHKGNRCTGDARRSLIFYDCLKCSASHNFAFADSNSRCVLSWRLRTSRASLASASWFLPRFFELARGEADLEIHRFDCLFPPSHWSRYFFFFYFVLSLLCAYFWNNLAIIIIIINSLK